MSRQIHIGRVLIETISVDQGFTCKWERSESSSETFYVLAMPLEGSLSFSQEGRIGIAEAGEYVLLSQLAFYELAAVRPGLLLLVKIPAAELRGRLVSIDDHVSRRFKANEHMGRLLSGLFRNVVDLFGDRAPPNPQALATEMIGFVALTVGAEDRGAATDVRNARYYLRRRIIEFIERHLSDSELSPKKIAASSRISLSYLYSLFNDDATTVGQFVQSRRLQKAYEILVADPRGHRTVSEIAYEVGFKNVSHFSRSFSRHFNIAPRDVRHLTRSQQTAPVQRGHDVGALVGDLGSLYWQVDKRRSVHESAL